MLLCIDIGNSNIKYGIFKNDELILNVRVQTNKLKTADEFIVDLFTIFNINKIEYKEIKKAIISSVVPKLTDAIKKAILNVLNINSLIVGPGVKTGLNILLDDPAQLGADLVAASIATSTLYTCPAIVISMGTATAMCIIDKNKNMKGGIIAPGVNVSLEALTNSTALLPSIGLSAPKSIIGKNTIDCIKSGVVIGEACKIDGLINKIEEELGEKCTIVATGGLAKNIVPNCAHKIIVDENLIINGLRLIYEKNK